MTGTNPYDEGEEWDYVRVDFHRERRIAKTRKEHTCHTCHWAIPAGSRAISYARRDEDTADGCIDYGYMCHYAGPCFDPSRLAEEVADAPKF